MKIYIKDDIKSITSKKEVIKYNIDANDSITYELGFNNILRISIKKDMLEIMCISGASVLKIQPQASNIILVKGEDY